MTTSANNTESKVDSTTTNSGYADPKTADDPNTANEGDKKPSDEGSDPIADMYEGEKKPEDGEKTDEKKITDEKKAEETEDIKDPATGYGEDDDKKSDEDKKPEEDKKDDDKETGELKKEDVDSALGELPEGYDKDRMSKFALDNKMTKEQIDAYVSLAKEESLQVKKDQQAQVLAQRKEWKNELVNDSTFGGEHFDKNVDRVEKILDKYMPNMKKVLTERGTMLPPYLMKDLLGISKALNPTTSLISGNPSKVETKESNFLDDMYK